MTHNHGPAMPAPETRPAGATRQGDDGEAHGHSMWWMVACCAPMVLFVLAVLLGVFGPR